MNHLTNASPFSHHACVPYTSQSKVVFGIGFSHNSFVVGSALITSDTMQLILHDMLYSTRVTKNLFSVSNFAKDNKVYVEFHASHCVIRDSISHKVLLRENEISGLYKLGLSILSS